MTRAAPGDALAQLAAVAANALVLAFGKDALRTGRHDNLALTDPIARLALTQALEAAVPGFPGLWLDLPAVDGPLTPVAAEGLPVAPPEPPGGGDAVDAFVRAVLHRPPVGKEEAPGA